MENENYEKIGKEMYINLDICPICHTLIYNYRTKNNADMWVTVYDDMSFHRFGNHNNYVAWHDCVVDKRESEIRTRKHINCIKVGENIKEMTPNLLQQQALMVALGYGRVRSTFKKAMKTQAYDYMNGNGKYANPFSHLQAIYIVLGNVFGTDYNEHVEVQNAESQEKARIVIMTKINELTDRMEDYRSLANEPLLSNILREDYQRRAEKTKNEIDILESELNHI
jgi:hypothetical protein